MIDKNIITKEKKIENITRNVFEFFFDKPTEGWLTLNDVSCYSTKDNTFVDLSFWANFKTVYFRPFTFLIDKKLEDLLEPHLHVVLTKEVLDSVYSANTNSLISNDMKELFLNRGDEDRENELKNYDFKQAVEGYDVFEKNKSENLNKIIIAMSRGLLSPRLFYAIDAYSYGKYSRFDTKDTILETFKEADFFVNLAEQALILKEINEDIFLNYTKREVEQIATNLHKARKLYYNNEKQEEENRDDQR